MHITWDPEDGSAPQTFEFDPEDMLRSEMTAIEKHHGESIDMWLQAVQQGSIKARAALLWLVIKRQHAKYRFDDVPDFRKRQLKVEMGSAELRTFFNRISKTKMDPDVREQFEAVFERDLQEAIERETGVVSGEVFDTNDQAVELGKQA